MFISVKVTTRVDRGGAVAMDDDDVDVGEGFDAAALSAGDMEDGEAVEGDGDDGAGWSTTTSSSSFVTAALGNTWSHSVNTRLVFE